MDRLLRSYSVLLAQSLWLAALAAAPVFAHDGDDHEHPVPAKPEATYRPSSVPDRICLCLTEQPATSMAVTWRTDEKTSKAIAQLASAAGGPGFTKSAVSVEGATQRLESNLGPAHFHEARFTDLEPKSKYLYRVGDGVNWSEWAEFETASESSEPFSFVYFGDAQNDIKSHWSRVVRNAFRDAPRASFFLHAGDLVNRAESDAEWGEWFYAGGFIHRMLPAMAVPGNHEMSRRGFSKRLSHHWRPTFAFPKNGIDQLPESNYTIDYQGVRFVCLNSNSLIEEQAKWLDQVLAETDGWKIVTHHHPIYSASAGRDNPWLRNTWQPIYDRHGVDLVLQGHDHTYARSQKMQHGDHDPLAIKDGKLVGETNVAEGASLRDKEGPVYVVSVSGPKMYKINKRPFMRSSAENTQLYQVISIEGDELRYRACTAIGETYDEFRLIRHDDRPNELIETE